MKKVLIIDTSILCVWLDVANMKTCGPDSDTWDKQRVEKKFNEETQSKTTFVLPLASIIETGNHIAQANRRRWESAVDLAALIRKTADEQTSWAAFADQSALWSPEKLGDLADTWPDHAARQLSLGDMTIKDVADWYANTGFSVEILTGDQGLKALQPTAPIEAPRRRRR